MISAVPTGLGTIIGEIPALKRRAIIIRRSAAGAIHALIVGDLRKDGRISRIVTSMD
jgi:hypothetical protein